MSKKIFFVGALHSSFVNNDYKNLQKYFSLRHFEMKRYMGDKLKVFKNVLWCDVVFGWFGSWRMVLPIIFAKLLHKKVIVTAVGFDVACAPEINYGAWRKNPDKRVMKFVFKHADLVLPISKFSQKELMKRLPVKETQIIYCGVNTKKFYPQGEKDDKLVITVGEIKWNNLKRKGIEDFVKAAKYLPDVNFVVIGKEEDSSIDYLKNIATNNVTFLGYVNDKDLLWLYQRAKVYAQLSYHEGFGVSVAEAMLCECIPVTSGKGALPEVVGMCGFYTPYGSPALAAVAIKKALNADWGKTFRARVLDKFSLDKRINKLREILE
jgi:glycosyltransferase involved in cell wall biosynthesis